MYCLYRRLSRRNPKLDRDPVQSLFKSAEERFLLPRDSGQ